MDGGVPHHALLAHLLPARLKLGLHQTHRLALRLEQAPKGGQDQFQGDEGHVHTGKVQLIGDLLVSQVAGVGALQTNHPLIAAEGPGQLAVAHVHGVHLHRPVLEHTVGKAAGGGADIAAYRPGQMDTLKGFHGLLQLQTAPAHIGQGLAAHLHGGVLGDLRPGLVHLLLLHINLAAHDDGLSPLAALRQPSLHQQHVQSLFNDCHGRRPPTPYDTGTLRPGRTGPAAWPPGHGSQSRARC